MDEAGGALGVARVTLVYLDKCLSGKTAMKKLCFPKSP